MKLADKLIISGLVLALGMLIYVAVVANSEGTQCLLSPLTYAADKLSEANNAEFVGSGSFLKEGSPLITFDRHNISIKSNLNNPSAKEIDWESLKNFTLIKPIND